MVAQIRLSTGGVAGTKWMLPSDVRGGSQELAPRPLEQGLWPHRGWLHLRQRSSSVRATLGSKLVMFSRVPGSCPGPGAFLFRVRPSRSHVSRGTSEGVGFRRTAAAGRRLVTASSRIFWQSGDSFFHSCRAGELSVPTVGVQTRQAPYRCWILRIGGTGFCSTGVIRAALGMGLFPSAWSRKILWASNHFVRPPDPAHLGVVRSPIRVATPNMHPLFNSAWRFQA